VFSLVFTTPELNSLQWAYHEREKGVVIKYAVAWLSIQTKGEGVLASKKRFT
jgi:hypothetical protein